MKLLKQFVSVVTAAFLFGSLVCAAESHVATGTKDVLVSIQITTLNGTDLEEGKGIALECGTKLEIPAGAGFDLVIVNAGKDGDENANRYVLDKLGDDKELHYAWLIHPERENGGDEDVKIPVEVSDKFRPDHIFIISNGVLTPAQFETEGETVYLVLSGPAYLLYATEAGYEPAPPTGQLSLVFLFPALSVACLLGYLVLTNRKRRETI